MGYCYTRESGLFVLADGMGGHPEGEVAAQLALQTVSSPVHPPPPPPPTTPPRLPPPPPPLAPPPEPLPQAPERAFPHAPRTTLVAAVLQAGSASWIHCGDSRLYMVRNAALLTRTRDHSYMELRNTPPPGQERINRNVLFTCLGSPTKPIYDLAGPVHLEQGDRILLGCDGVWSPLSDAEIARLLARNTVSRAVPGLVEEALRKAGDNSDNATPVAPECELPDALAPPREGVVDDRAGLFASTIQARPPEEAVEEQDETTIERSIPAINEVICRATARKT